MTKYFIGGDIGGTASRFCIINETGAAIQQGIAPGATALIFSRDIRSALNNTIIKIAENITWPIDGAAFGLTGYGPRARNEISAIIRNHIELADENIFLSDDIELAFRSLFKPGKGHLVSAGTGSIAVHLRQDGSLLRAGGRGILVDDAGSGGWIALCAVRALYRQIDEQGKAGNMIRLADAVFSAIGADDWSDMRTFIYGGDRGRIGVLAKSVAEAAEAGDTFSKDLLRQAGIELARLGNILLGRGGSHPVAFIGGVLKLTPIINDTISETLCGKALFPVLNQAEGAAHLARILFNDNSSKSGQTP